MGEVYSISVLVLMGRRGYLHIEKVKISKPKPFWGNMFNMQPGQSIHPQQTPAPHQQESPPPAQPQPQPGPDSQLRAEIPFNFERLKDFKGYMDPFEKRVYVPIVVLVFGASVFVESSIFMFAVITLILISMVALMWYRWQANRHNSALLALFAAENGLSFSPTTNDTGSGSLFSLGSRRQSRDVISGRWNGYQFAFFKYQYSTYHRSGRHRRRRDHRFSVMRVTLPYPMPHIVIDSLLNHTRHKSSVLPAHFDKSQKIQLEGDFHKYFDLYAPEQRGVDLLHIMAPDAMEVLLEHGTLADIEIIDNYLYFYWAEYQDDYERYIEIFTSVQQIWSSIERATRSVGSDVSERIAQGTAFKGARLKRPSLSLGVAVLIVGGVIFAAIAVSSPSVFELIYGVVMLALFVGVPFMHLRRWIIRSRLQRDLEQRRELIRS